MLIELDEGYSFGLGLFETILLYKGKPVFLDEHLVRINKAIIDWFILAKCSSKNTAFPLYNRIVSKSPKPKLKPSSNSINIEPPI